jgi:voltage-gated potassium channel
MTNDVESAAGSTALSPSQERRQKWLAAYSAKTSPALSALALVYLVTFSIQSIWYQPEQTWYRALFAFGIGLWALFAADLLLRFIVSPVKRHFLRHNLLDTITVIVPQFRALRSLRAFTPNGILSKKTGALTSGGAASAALAALIVVWVGSLMVLNAERSSPKAEIVNIGDSVWWSFETITTVGYGDFVPVTWNGRLIAVLIMLVGISALGAVTATLSAVLVKRGHQASNPNAQVLAEIAELKSMVSQLQASVSGSSGPKQSPQ